VLCSAGYNALTTATIDDALILLKATKTKLVVIPARMQSAHGKPTRKSLEEIDPAVSLLILDENLPPRIPEKPRRNF
jgi:DNA-binding NtrC family response regulator